MKIESLCSEMEMTLSLLQIVKLFLNPFLWQIVADHLEIYVHSWLEELHKKHIMIKANTCEEFQLFFDTYRERNPIRIAIKHQNVKMQNEILEHSLFLE